MAAPWRWRMLDAGAVGDRDRRAVRGLSRSVRPAARLHRRPSARASVPADRAKRCIRVAGEIAPDAWVRQCGRAVRHSLERKRADPRCFEQRFRRPRRPAASPPIRPSPAPIDFTPDADFATTFSAISRRPARRRVWSCAIPAGSMPSSRGSIHSPICASANTRIFIDDAFPRLLAERGVALV